MKTITRLLIGNHPKAAKLKERVTQIVKLLKQNNNKIEATQLEAALGISRTERPAMFYKPLHFMRKWDLIQVHKKVELDTEGKKHFKTTYEFTPEMFYHYIEKTLLEVVKSELESL